MRGSASIAGPVYDVSTPHFEADSGGRQVPSDVTVVADVGMISEANHEAVEPSACSSS